MKCEFEIHIIVSFQSAESPTDPIQETIENKE